MSRIAGILVLMMCIVFPGYAEIDLSGMTRAELVVLQAQVESALQALDIRDSIDSANLGMWEVEYYIDEFKMPTDEAYIRNTKMIEGTFSNSATDNSELLVRFLVDKNDVAIMLYEYGRNQVKNPYSDTEYYTINVLDSSGVKRTFEGMLYSDGNRIYVEDSLLYEDKAAFLEILKQPGAVRFSIVEDDRRTTKYFFVVEDTSGFGNAYNILMD